MKRSVFNGFAFAMLVIIMSCTPHDDYHTILVNVEALEAPTNLAGNIDRWYRYRIRVTSAEFEADTIICEVRRGNETEVIASFTLYDDGSMNTFFGPDFASTSSGDIVPNDNVFTRSINGQLLADDMPGVYTFDFTTYGERLVSGETTFAGDTHLEVQIQNVEPCLITYYPQMQIIDSCFTPIEMEVRVGRTEADVVDTVRVLLCDPLVSCAALGDFVPVQGDTVWQLTLTPAMFRCAQSFDSGVGYYSLLYQAKTRFGMNCEQDVGPIGFFNSHPVLSNSTLPDTIFRPTTPGDVDSTAFTVDLTDCELVGNPFYYGVKYGIRRRDQSGWTESPQFWFRDDGVPPDVIAGNGVFSAGISVESDDPDSLYYFRFFAVECAAPYDTSEFLIDSVQIWPQPGTILTRRSQLPTGPTGAFPRVFQ